MARAISYPEPLRCPHCGRPLEEIGEDSASGAWFHPCCGGDIDRVTQNAFMRWLEAAKALGY